MDRIALKDQEKDDRINHLLEKIEKSKEELLEGKK